jgi:Ca-activated chloride channel homolog
MTVRGGARVCAFVALALWLAGCGRGALGRGAQTPGDDDGAVALDAAASNSFVPASEPSAVKVRLRVAARSHDSAQRPQINLVLVVDTSGSMQGDAIENSRAASAALLELLSPGDRLAVVTFDSTTRVLVPSTELRERSFGRLREQIAAMTAQGTTDLAGGLREGINQATIGFDSRGLNRIVLLSDGVPNDATEIQSLATSAGQSQLAITALGLGLEYDETLLGQVAQASGGRFHYLESSARVAEVFRDEVLRLERVAARNAVVTVTPGPGVAIETVVGLPSSSTGRGVQIGIGDLAEGETRDLIVQLAVSGRREGANVELLDAVLGFDDALGEAGRLERRRFLGARATANAQEIAAGRNDEVERDALRIETAAATVQAISAARSGDVAQARQILQSSTAALQTADFSDDESLAEASADVEALGGALERIAPAASPAPGGASAPARASAAPAAPAEESYDFESERVVREVHGRAMDAIYSEKC